MSLRIQLNTEWEDAEMFAKRFSRKLRLLGLEHLMLGGRFLDVGCGDGKLIHELAKIYPTASYSGVDASREQVETAKRNNPQSEMRYGYFSSIPFGDEQFTVAFSNNIFTYVEDREEELPAKEVYRILRKGGIYYVQEAYYKNLVNSISSFGLVPMHRDFALHVFQKPP